MRPMALTPALVAALFCGCNAVDTELLGGGGDGGCLQSRTLAGVCAGAFTASAHRYALCTCDALAVTAPLTSTAFDSSGGTAPAIASVGTNADFTSSAEVNLGGALWAAGAVTLGDDFECAGSLHAGATLTAHGEAEIHGDAFVGGDVSGGVNFEQSLHLPSASMLDPLAHAQSVIREPVSVDPPCDCDGALALDLGGEIAAAAAHNDDAQIGLGAGALTAASLDLPCGVFYVDSVQAGGLVTLKVHGLAELVVAHDLRLQGGLSVALDSGAELDLLWGGAFTSSGGGDIGSPVSPPRVRLWTASSDSLTFDGNPTLHAALTAPRAAVTAPSGLTVEGALLCAQLSAGRTQLHYDRALLSAGASCGAAAETPVE